MNKRRIILHSITCVAAAAGAGIPFSALAQAPRLDENDPQAVSLGYRHDTTKVDQKKFPKHDTAQACANCQLYQGPPEAPWAPCAIFGGKQVAAKGWCSAWVKKTTPATKS
ncbi:MAG: iron permease [Herminiimonas sp.]|jgi:hypothetical protein|nr:iron permease [Herminiimonas sp.]